MNEQQQVKTKNVRVDYRIAYQNPFNYHPPSNEQLPGNVDYPHLNTLEYRLQAAPTTHQLYNCFDLVRVNEKGVVTVVCNNLAGRYWHGCVYGFNNFEDLAADSAEDLFVYRFLEKSHITGLQLMKNDLLLMTQTDGTVRLYSLCSAMRPKDANGYNVFQVGSSYAHICSVTSMDIDRSCRNGAVTGDKSGCLRTWELLDNVRSTSLYRRAHKGPITGISTSPITSEEFVTCSADFSVLWWDKRQPLPALCLYRTNVVEYSSIYWTTDSECNGMICVGDVSGFLTILDPRKPGTPVTYEKIDDGSINELVFQQNKMVVTSNSRSTLVYDVKSEKPKLLYQDTSAPSHVKSAVWVSDDTFWTVGWKKYVKKHVVNES